MKMCEMYEKVSAFVAVDIERVKRDLMPQVKDDIYRSNLEFLGDDIVIEFCEQQSNSLYCVYYFMLKRTHGSDSTINDWQFVSADLDLADDYGHSYRITEDVSQWLSTHYVLLMFCNELK